jgi:hypothetical protein
MSSPIQALGEEVQAGFSGFKPENINDLTGMFDDLPEFWNQFADGIRTLASRFDDELPVDPAVAEAIREMGATVVGLREHCVEMAALFERAHEAELKRLREPRVNEKMWDVQNQE